MTKNEIFLVDPEKLFCYYHETPVVKPGDYYDRTEIGMSNYLQVMPSIALHGFRYAVFIDRSFKVLDGYYRVLSALELGLNVPVTFQTSMHYWKEHGWKLRFIYALRLLFKRRYLFFKKIKVKEDNRVNAGSGSLVCLFQKNIFELYRS